MERFLTFLYIEQKIPVQMDEVLFKNGIIVGIDNDVNTLTLNWKFTLALLLTHLRVALF